MKPELKEYVNQYVRAVYDFDTNHPREIQLCKGDIIKVTSVVDSNWLCGQLRGQEGNFPSSFVEKLTFPAAQEGQKLFGAIENFPALQAGDLEFRKGAVILGVEPVDTNWWTGQLGSNKGIFPLTHVIELQVPSVLRERSKSCYSSEPLFAQALCDSVAQLDEELSFRVGDIITVTEVIDSDWYFGELGNKKGMFLSSCVELIQDDASTVDSGKNISKSDVIIGKQNQSYLQKSYSFDQSYYGSLEKSQSDFNHTVEKFVPRQSNSQSVGNVSEHATSKNSSDSVVDKTTDSSISDSSAYTSENTKSLESSVNPYAVSQYPFAGQSEDELTFEANEIIYLIQHVDQQWTEGEIDGKIGLFPTSFVSIIVDCPYAFTSSESKNENDNSTSQENKNTSEANSVSNSSTGDDQKLMETSAADGSASQENKSMTEATVSSVHNSNSSDGLKPTEGNEPSEEVRYALVLHSFPAEVAGDLGLEEGETVTIISSVDENWMRAKNEKGEIGLCPKQFLEFICDSPTENLSKISNGHTLSSILNIKDEPKIVPNQNESKCDSKAHTKKSTPPVRLKPQLGPKPVLKPKPALLPKPVLNAKTLDANYKKVCSDDSALQKSTSSLSSFEEKQGMKKSVSSVEIGRGKNNFMDSELNKMIDGEISKSKLEYENQTQLYSEQSDITSTAQGSQEKDVGVVPLRKKLVESEGKSKRHSVNIPMANSSSKNHSSNISSKSSRSPLQSHYSIGQSTFFCEPDFTSSTRIPPMRKPPPIPQRAFETDDIFNRKPSLRKAPPPRPTGPRIAAAPSKEPLLPVKVETSKKRVPQRPAPSRPLVKSQEIRPLPQELMAPPRRPPPRAPQVKSSDLMRFSPPKEEKPDEANEEVIADLRKRIKEMEEDLQNCKKSKEEMEAQLNEGDNQDEVHDNIDFYDANINGLTEELNKMKENLQQLCPEEYDIIAKEKMEEERRKAEEQRKEEERKMSEEAKAKRFAKREKVIEELIQTEKDFLQGLELCMDVFVSPDAEKHPDVDTELLLGNMEDIFDVSQRLLAKLEHATQDKEFHEQTIGVCFISLADDMKNAYAPYCRNHDGVINLLEKYRENASISAFLQSQLNKLRERSVVFDLEALLIKPVQRILKYPLLLNELFKSTEDDHPDKQEILKAINAMTDVAAAINEYKRRTDLVYKYKKDTDQSFGDMLAKLSFHTIKKKGSRIKGRISSNLGFSQTRDEAFDSEELRFRQLEKIVKIFVRDVQAYMQQIQDSVTLHENLVADVIDFYDDKQHSHVVQQLEKAQQLIDQTLLPEFQESVTVMVTAPLNKLSQMFEGPIKVIQKRYDKLLDYDSMLRKGKDEKATEKALNKAKADYEALNAQLLDELPKLYSLSLQLLEDCVATFVQSQQEYSNKLFLHMSDMLDLPSLLTHGENIVETFNIKHVAVVDRLSLLSFIPKGFNPKMDAVTKAGDKKTSKRQSLVATESTTPQLDSQRVYVQQQYSADKLYHVIQTYSATDMMDISLHEGDIVGVVMNKDPMGNKERWFVDNGVTKGFVPSYILQLYQASPPQPAKQLYPDITVSQSEILSPSKLNHSPQSPTVSPSTNIQMNNIPSPGVGQRTSKNFEVLNEDDLSGELEDMLEEDMTPDISDDMSGNSSYQPECEEFYYAEYAFEARNSNEVALFEGQVVTVLAKHDEENNTEWWYVDADGRHGYTPSAYLKPMS